MPVHPSEENAPEGLTEKVAKDPSSTTESTASEHEGHANEHNPLGMSLHFYICFDLSCTYRRFIGRSYLV